MKASINETNTNSIGNLKMTEKEIDIVKTCASIIAKRYDRFEPWVCPNVLLRQYGITDWEYCGDYWYDPETGASYPC